MKEGFMEDVYLSVQGLLEDEQRIPGVENAFAEGSRCDRLYKDMGFAYERICERLGTGEEDSDLEIIVNAMWDITKELCCRMYEYGGKFGM